VTHASDEQLRDELLAMEREDRETRARLEASGSLFRGYDDEMRAVHERNAKKLERNIETHGWPGRSLAGADGAAAAWLVLQHAISRPSLMRLGLELVREAAAEGEAEPSQVAYLLDRIRTLEGRPQVYGTQYDWDPNGRLSPLPIEDPQAIDERRAAVGLSPLAENTAAMRRAASSEPPPSDWQERQQETEQWARSVGWRLRGRVARKVSAPAHLPTIEP